jgi:hypothetical protein
MYRITVNDSCLPHPSHFIIHSHFVILCNAFLGFSEASLNKLRKKDNKKLRRGIQSLRVVVLFPFHIQKVRGSNQGPEFGSPEGVYGFPDPSKQVLGYYLKTVTFFFTSQFIIIVLPSGAINPINKASLNKPRNRRQTAGYEAEFATETVFLVVQIRVGRLRDSVLRQTNEGCDVFGGLEPGLKTMFGDLQTRKQRHESAVRTNSGHRPDCLDWPAGGNSVSRILTEF